MYFQTKVRSRLNCACIIQHLSKEGMALSAKVNTDIFVLMILQIPLIKECECVSADKVEEGNIEVDGFQFIYNAQ